MLKKVFGLMLVLALLAPITTNAMDMTGKWGLGYFSSDAPVGVRYWLNQKLGVDLGVGFESKDLGDNTATSFWFEGGFPYVLMDTDRANFFVRPGVVFASLDDRVYGTGVLDKKWNNITIKLTPGAEVFFGDHFSLQAAHGIMIDLISPPDGAGDSKTDFNTGAYSVSEIGFHFYFK
jgi:hypothetical protein